MGFINFLGRLFGKNVVNEAKTVVVQQKPLEKFIEKLGFKGKPRTLGEGLARVKKAMGATGEPIYNTGDGYRVYKTPNGNEVTMRSGEHLNIEKSLNYRNFIGDYTGTPGAVTRWYTNRPLADHKFEIDRRTFVNQIEDTYQFPDLLKTRRTDKNFVDSFHLVKRNAEHNIDIPNRRVISIDQARNMGMKI